MGYIEIIGARENNLQNINLKIPRGQWTIITGVSGSGKSSLAFDTILAEAQRRFFATLSGYTRQFLDLASRPNFTHISGLSPASGLAQNEVLPSVRVTIGSLTDIHQLLAILFARFGTRLCPHHGCPTAPQDLKISTQVIATKWNNQLVAVVAPLFEGKKRNFQKELSQLLNKGYLKIVIDGELIEIKPDMKLEYSSKTTVELCVDFVKVKASNQDRLLRSLNVAAEEGKGVVRLIPIRLEAGNSRLVLSEAQTLSQNDGCPQCGHSWPQLDPRHFSFGSLGRCSDCSGKGFEGELIEQSSQCLACMGTGIDQKYRSVELGGICIQDALNLSLDHLIKRLKSSDFCALQDNRASGLVLGELIKNLDRIADMGLGYLAPSRKVKTLATGELQRLRLAGCIGGQLRDMIYVMDEPSFGLHPFEVKKQADLFRQLTQNGHTLICVDHNDILMRHADLIVDMGPGGGHQGGQIQAVFHPRDAVKYKGISLTAHHLATIESNHDHSKPEGVRSSEAWLRFQEPRRHNLRGGDYKIPLHTLTVVTGVSGSGKSSLLEIIQNVVTQSHKERYDRSECSGLTRVLYLNRSPLRTQGSSFLATYLGIFTELRNLYEKLPEAQILGITARSLSLVRTGSRCEACKGRGYQLLSMKFLQDAEIICSVCQGRRFDALVDHIKLYNFSLPELLQRTIAEVRQIFASYPKIVKYLDVAVELGLGYLKLGQPTSRLSGGECQRLRLAQFFASRADPEVIVLMDEPSSGLHQQDVVKLIEILKNLVAKDVTVVAIEHHPHIVFHADWVLELGPGAGAEGGQLIGQGPPERICQMPHSIWRSFYR